jgi:hypothetical protein
MNQEMTLLALKYLNKQYEFGSMLSAEQFQQVLPLLEEVLASEDLRRVDELTGARARFLYQKAVALDMTGKTEEALELLIGLVNEHPGAPEFESSLNVVCGKFHRKARDLVTSKPEDPILKAFLNVLEQYGYPPYWLIHAVAAQEAKDGKTREAFGRMQALLALSPNDEDYLRVAIDIAKQCNLDAKAKELEAHVRALLEKQPYRLELAELLPPSGGSSPVSGQK